MNSPDPRFDRRAPARPIRVLFIHQNFPGQFWHLAARLAQDPRYSLIAIGKQGCPALKSVPMILYSLHRVGNANTHHYAKPYESAILHGQSVSRLLLKLKANGYTPDVVIGHSGWGETMFVKDVFPGSKLINFSEYFYRAAGADVGFDPEFPLTLNDEMRIRAKNATLLLGLETCDIAVAPTHWQKSLHPSAYQEKIQVIHEGIDTDFMRADPNAEFTLPNGTVLRPGDPVVTYVARNLEPYRGFHIFMRALPRILARHPNCQIVVVGGDGVSYGGAPNDAVNWREKLCAEVTIDRGRVHFVGRLPYALYRNLMRVSAAHVYLTYPFVLSWSLLEAMACGCLVVASNTKPVLEVIRDGHAGFLVDFFDVDEIANRVAVALENPFRVTAMRSRAVEIVQAQFSLDNGAEKYRELVDTMLCA
jgi:glycosyltransferase involved in cell wall biosynthesis